MFERYTEKARRVIFFARYEASQYGSRYIETEHMLLGLLREDRQIAAHFLERSGGTKSVRREIESRITVGERISTSVEMPLTQEAKWILNFAGQEVERLGHKYVGTEHLLLGMLRVEGSVAADMLAKRGVKLEAVREYVEKNPASTSAVESPRSRLVFSRPISRKTVENFLTALREPSAEELAPFFAENAQLIDCKGKLWQGLKEIDLDAFFAPYAKRTVRPMVDTSNWGPANSLVANVLWENVSVPGESIRSTHRMTIIFAHRAGSLAICLLQVTPVVPI